MHIPIKDEYVRDFSFEPEIILRRKDSLDIQREKYHRKRLNSRRKRLKRNALLVLAKTAAIVPPPLGHQQRVVEKNDPGEMPVRPYGVENGSRNSETSACLPTTSSSSSRSSTTNMHTSSRSNAMLIDVPSPNDCPAGSGLDDLDPADKDEIRRSIVDIEIEEFYYVSAVAHKEGHRQTHAETLAEMKFTSHPTRHPSSYNQQTSSFFNVITSVYFRFASIVCVCVFFFLFLNVIAFRIVQCSKESYDQ